MSHFLIDSNGYNNYFEEEPIKIYLFSDSQGRGLPDIIGTISKHRVLWMVSLIQGLTFSMSVIKQKNQMIVL